MPDLPTRAYVTSKLVAGICNGCGDDSSNRRHSLFAARDQHRLAAEMRKQLAARVVERFFVGQRLARNCPASFALHTIALAPR